MTVRFRRKLLVASLMAAGSGVVMPAMAQSTSGAMALEEIVVTARRREESLQDVPIMVNAVQAERLDELNIRQFDDLQGVVAGLTLEEDSIAPNASVRGVRYDTFSGTNATVEFYLNDSPVTPLTVMQALFDVGQIEVLRGPQGTLRGRASPSGSITVTTQRPNMTELGGYIDVTATDQGGKNFRGALNLPIVEDVLAARLAGFWEENDMNGVRNVFSGNSSKYEGEGYRLSLAYTPLDNLSINLMHQIIRPERRLQTPVESANRAAPGLPASEIPLRPGDRRAVQDLAEVSEQDLKSTILEVAWDLGDHQINYVGSYVDETIERLQPGDGTNAIDATRPDAWQGTTQQMTTVAEVTSHELRIQSLEPLFGKVDYVFGALYSTQDSDVDLVNQTLLEIAFPLAPGVYLPVAHATTDTGIITTAYTREQSFFANLTYHLGDNTELSAGLRHIDYKIEQLLVVGSNTLQDDVDNWDDVIYSLSLKHDFTDSLMGYASYGTSWRRGFSAIGDFSAVKSERQRMFTTLGPETSESFELGIKSSWLDNRLQINAAAYYQEFDDYPYRSGSSIYYASYAFSGFDPNTGAPIISPEVGAHNFVAAVPVEVYGIEVETAFQATENWHLGALFSYAKGEIKNGLIPCNDYLPHDGVADSGNVVPSLGDIFAAAGSENLTACSATLRSNFAPLWTATLTSEYNLGQVAGLDAYVRGLWTFYGNSQNDPTNPVDDVGRYNILNLYAGVRDPQGRWEAMVYAKNVADTEKVISRDAQPGSVSYQVIDAVAQVPVGAENLVSGYRVVGLTAPREFGINFRYNF